MPHGGDVTVHTEEGGGGRRRRERRVEVGLDVAQGGGRWWAGLLNGLDPHDPPPAWQVTACAADRIHSRLVHLRWVVAKESGGCLGLEVVNLKACA
jgi:hypothetical protein